MLITFGDIFQYRGKVYVYLAKTEEVLYAAQILPQKETDLVNTQYEKVIKQQHREMHIKSNRLYCFVILRTENFRGRAAHLGQPEMGDGILPDVYERLCKEDLEEMKHEIMRTESPVPRKLKELVADIDI